MGKLQQRVRGSCGGRVWLANKLEAVDVAAICSSQSQREQSLVWAARARTASGEDADAEDRAERAVGGRRERVIECGGRRQAGLIVGMLPKRCVLAAAFAGDVQTAAPCARTDSGHNSH